MANYTEKAIIQTFEDMVRVMPFDKVSVSSIVAKCEISSNTFYYHFHDIYDLLDTWLRLKGEKYLNGKDINEHWKDILKEVLYDVQKNPSIVNHIFNSISRDRLERYVFNTLEVKVLELIKKRDDKLSLSGQEQKLMAGACCYTLLGFLIRFVWNNTQDDVESSVENLAFLFEGIVMHMQDKHKK